MFAAAGRLREERLRVRPAVGAGTFTLDGDSLLVPDFRYVDEHLSRCAWTKGVAHPDVARYLDSIVGFARMRGGALFPLRQPDGGYATTEAEILAVFPPPPVDLPQAAGLELVRKVCDRHEEQVRRPSAAEAGEPDGR